MIKQSLPSLFIAFLLLLSSTVLNASDTESSPPDSLDRLTDKLLSSLSGEPDGSVLAVLSLRNTDGRDSVLGSYLEGKIVDRLISHTKFSIVERNQLEQVLQEWEYSLSGIMEEESMYEIGSMAGADAVIVGMLTRIDQSVQVNLRIIDPESALVSGSVDSLLTEPAYLSMYLDVYDRKILTEEDFFMGRGRDFNRDRAFLDSFFDLCRDIEEHTGRADFLDESFLEYLEASAQVGFRQGSRLNCTLKVRKDQLEPKHLYNFFFSDGRSHTVWFFDKQSYGWHTNPFFQTLVEQEYDTYGVPDIYKNAAARSRAFSAPSGTSDTSSSSIDNGQIQCSAEAAAPEWALVKALMKAAVMLETRMEVVALRDDAESVDFITEYVPLRNLERISENITAASVQRTGDRYVTGISVDLSDF